MLNVETILNLKVVEKDDLQWLSIDFEQPTEYLPDVQKNFYNKLASHAASCFGVLDTLAYPGYAILEANYPKLVKDDKLNTLFEIKEINTAFDSNAYDVNLLMSDGKLYLFVLNYEARSFGFIPLK